MSGPTTLFIFPHAGGSPTYYVPFAKSFTTDIKRIAVQYPGKGGTHDLTSFRSIPDLADRVMKLLPAPTDGTVAFFGHSMGALVAFEVARRYEAAGNPISALFVSASPAPGAVGAEYIPESDRGLLEAVATMTGVNPEFLENEEFAARILPTLRGFKAIMDYECPPEATVSFDGRTTEVVARQLSEEGRAEVWPRLVAVWPLYDTYEDRAGRGLRVFHLTPAPMR